MQVYSNIIHKVSIIIYVHAEDFAVVKIKLYPKYFIHIKRDHKRHRYGYIDSNVLQHLLSILLYAISTQYDLDNVGVS